MTSAKEGQPPSNEPEEWQDTHPLSQGLKSKEFVAYSLPGRKSKPKKHTIFSMIKYYISSLEPTWGSHLIANDVYTKAGVGAQCSGPAHSPY